MAPKRTSRILPRKFYDRDTALVARELLGKRLVRKVGRQRVSGIIVETEAYLGAEDRAAHTFGGRRTERNEIMWGHAGHAYVYFIYGMHFCLNAVTREAGRAEAVLIRAIEIDEGLDQILVARAARFGEEAPLSKIVGLTNGPGKLCEALQIKRGQNGVDLTADKSLFIEDSGKTFAPSMIVASKRIGVDYAKAARHWPLRFSIRGNPFVSKPWPAAAKVDLKAPTLFRNL